MWMTLAAVALVGILAVAAHAALGNDGVKGIPNNFPVQRTPVIGVFIQPADDSSVTPGVTDAARMPHGR